MKPKIPTLEALQKECDLFNARVPIGTRVVRYKLIKPLRMPDKPTFTRSAAWVVGGHSVLVQVAGVTGGVVIESVQTAEEYKQEPPRQSMLEAMLNAQTMDDLGLPAAETEFVRQIARRGGDLFYSVGIKYPSLFIEVDIADCHKACPLDLARLLALDDKELCSQLLAIRRGLEHPTGNLKPDFRPLCAL